MPNDYNPSAHRSNKRWGGLEGKKARFLSKIDKKDNGCWYWTGAVGGNNPYGVCRNLSGRTTTAHRVSYELFVDKLIPGLEIMHSCDTPICVNPKHLSQGTIQENKDDMVRKGRQSKLSTLPDQTGVKNYNTKLTEKEVLNVRQLYRDGKSITEISKVTGVPSANVGAIVHRKSWKHLP